MELYKRLGISSDKGGRLCTFFGLYAATQCGFIDQRLARKRTGRKHICITIINKCIILPVDEMSTLSLMAPILLQWSYQKLESR